MGLKGFIRKFVAQNKSEVTQKPIDVYSMSHILMGIITYGILWFFLGAVFPSFFVNDIKWISIISVLFWAVIWEYLENFLLVNTRFKTNQKKDSLENSLTDVVFTGIGGFITFGCWQIGFMLISWISFVGIYNWVKKYAMG